MVKKKSSKRKNSYINRLRKRHSVRSKQYAGWRKQFKNNYMSRLRSRKRSRTRNQKGGALLIKKMILKKKPHNCPQGESWDNVAKKCMKITQVYGNTTFPVKDNSKNVIQGGFSMKNHINKTLKAQKELVNDLVLIFTSKESLKKKYKDDPDKVIKLIQRRTKVRNKALIYASILLVLGAGYKYADMREKQIDKQQKKRRKESNERINKAEKALKDAGVNVGKVSSRSSSKKKKHSPKAWKNGKVPADFKKI